MLLIETHPKNEILGAYPYTYEQSEQAFMVGLLGNPIPVVFYQNERLTPLSTTTNTRFFWE